jgi:VWFA-related protein
MRRLLAVVCCVTSALCALDAQAPQRPAFRSGVDVVTVDVRVIDRQGRPVGDLGPADFVVSVDGRARTVVAAEFVSYSADSVGSRPAPASDPTAPAPPVAASDTPSPGRTIVIVVDEEHIRAGYGKWAGDAAAKFIDRMHPTDRVGLVVPRSNIRVAPTTEHAVVKAALGHLVGHMSMFNAGGGTIILADACGSAPSAMLSDMKDRVFSTLRSLEDLFVSLGSEPGSKTVLLISEELPICDQGSDRLDFRFYFERISEAAARAQAMLYVMQLDRPVADAEDPQRASQNQRVQPGREQSIRNHGLETVVSVTGGKRLLVSGRPDAVLERVAVEISGQYLLGFSSEAPDRDGKARSIKVTVKRKGVEVYARKMFAYSGR